LELKPFARTGRKVSEVGMGTYYDPLWIATSFLGWKRGAATKTKAIRAGLDAGMTLVDTAELYGSEPLVAEAMRGVKREEVFLATKAWSNHLRRDALIRSFEKSLKRLGTSYIDLYQVHFPNSRVQIRETMAAMQELVDGGKLGHIGVSNFNLSELQEANSALPKAQLSSVQLDYSLIHRNVESEILPYCDREGIALLAYFPLGHGKLVSDHRLDRVASRQGKSRAQVALRWLARKPNVFPIPRASSAQHVVENAGANGWDVTDQDAAELEARFR
jgi:diketogulonate reductase-like aldo/keto reductase